MTKPPFEHRFSRRERQAMDVVYRLGEASVADVLERVPDAAGYNAVRNTLSILVNKGFLRRRREGQRFIYATAVPVATAKRSAMRHLMKTFFSGSPRDAILTMLDLSSARLSEDELDEIAAWIDERREDPS
jgi:predicted transcriptional regulator